MIPAVTRQLAEDRKSRTDQLMLLKEGSESPPVFMAHGLGDTVNGLRQLASHMQVTDPIYGMQARGIDGREEPLDRIEDMAEFHLDAVRQLQPHGPYFLIGYSLGGLVTLEIARRLSADGEKIGLLVMLDSYPDRRRLSIGQHARLLLQLGKLRAASFMRAKGQAGRNSTGAAHLDAPSTALQRVKDYQYRALRNYRPQFYGGKINFVQAATRSFFPKNPAAAWSHLASEFEIETVPCDHLGMLTTHAENLAASVSRLMRKAIRQESAT